jgi:hypothetical protein
MYVKIAFLTAQKLVNSDAFESKSIIDDFSMFLDNAFFRLGRFSANSYLFIKLSGKCSSELIFLFCDWSEFQSKSSGVGRIFYFS